MSLNKPEWPQCMPEAGRFGVLDIPHGAVRTRRKATCDGRPCDSTYFTNLSKELSRATISFLAIMGRSISVAWADPKLRTLGALSCLSCFDLSLPIRIEPLWPDLSHRPSSFRHLSLFSSISSLCILDSGVAKTLFQKGLNKHLNG